MRSVASIARGVAKAVVGLAALVGLAVATRPKPPTVEALAVRRGALRVTMDAEGRTRVKDRTHVVAPAGGTLLPIALRPGDAVEVGATVATLLPPPPSLLDARTRAAAEAHARTASAVRAEARVAVARAELASQRAEHEAAETRRLAAAGAESGDRLERAELEARLRGADLAAARFAEAAATHEAEVARAGLREGGDSPGDRGIAIKTPSRGVVLRVAASEGLVGAGAVLVEVGDPSALEVVVPILTEDAPRVRPSALTLLDGWGGPALRGRVRRVEPSASTRVSSLGVEEQRVNVLVDLESAQEGTARLGDGYRVDAHLVVSETADAVVAPVGALVRDGSGPAVFVLDRDVARRRPVELGARSAAEIEVRTGLVPGERVVMHPGDRVVDGARVAPR